MTTTPLGDCYRYAVQKAMELAHNKALLEDKSRLRIVHGHTTDYWNKKSVLHAWVEKGNKVYDYRTRVLHPDGLDKDLYYKSFQPEKYHVFSVVEALRNCVRQGHYGPWNEVKENPSEDFDADAYIEEAENIMARWAAWWQDNPHAEGPALVYYFKADGKQYMTPIDPFGDVLSQMVSGASDLSEGIVGTLYLTAAHTMAGLGQSLVGSLNLPDRGIMLLVRVGGTVQIIEDKHLAGNTEPALKNPGPALRRKRKFQEPWEHDVEEVYMSEALIPGAGFVEAGIAHVLERLNELGYKTAQSASGLAADKEGRKPGGGYIAFFQKDLTEPQIEALCIAAEAAGLTFRRSDGKSMLHQPSVTVRTSMTKAGVSHGDLQRIVWKELEDEYGEERPPERGDRYWERIAELVDEHGSMRDDNDLWIRGAWQRFIEALEAIAIEGAAATTPGGNAFDHAFLFVHNNPTELRLVHGLLHPPGEEPYVHAWAEDKRGRIYDWALAQQHPQGVPASWYYDWYKPEPVHFYTSTESFIKAMEEQTAGPWEDFIALLESV